MKKVSHGGCLGDIISALPALKEFTKHHGAVDFYAYPRSGPRVRMNPEYLNLIKPLLLAQPYINSVQFSDNPAGTQLDDWRGKNFPTVYSLADRHLDTLGYSHKLRDEIWLIVPKSAQPQNSAQCESTQTIFVRSPRLRNPHFNWNKYHQKYPDAVLLGTKEEHELFEKEVGPIKYQPTENLLEAAQVIQEAQRIFTNQTSLFWIAESLKKEIYLEVEPNGTDWSCYHDRPKLHYIQNSAQENQITIEPTQTLTLPQPAIHSKVAFLGLLKDQDGYDSAYRELNTKTQNVHTDVRYQRYDLNLNPIGESKMILHQAEDPRVFRWGDQPLTTAIIYRPTPNYDEWLQIVVNMHTGHVHPIQHDLRYAGKNWVPVTGGNTLLMIRSLDPLCVLAVDTGDWKAKAITPEPPSREIGQYRGGAAATISGHMITGYGHRTIPKPVLKHVPFLYTINTDTWSITFHDLKPIGFDTDLVIDPTSELGDGKIVCTCAQKSWWYEQEITTKICQITTPEI